MTDRVQVLLAIMSGAFGLAGWYFGELQQEEQARRSPELIKYSSQADIVFI